MTIPKQTAIFSCPSCQIGHLRAQRVLYFNQGSTCPIVASQFPAWVCDLCGFRAYDPQTLAQVHAMLWMRPRMRPSIQLKNSETEANPQHQNPEGRRHP